MSTDRPFDPSEHIFKFKRRQRQEDGSYQTVEKDYLPVAARIAWFRYVRPNGNIVTRLISKPGDDPAVVEATVSWWDEGGEQVIVTGHGQVSQEKWQEYLEKAETRAIGRALGAAGFGTLQSGNEFDEADPGQSDTPEGGQRGDTPARPQSQSAPARQARPPSSGESFDPPSQPQGKSEGAAQPDQLTKPQRARMFARAKELGFSGKEELRAFGSNLIGRQVESINDFTKDEASQIITALTEM